MIIKIKSGKKGRPLSLNTSELEQQLYSDMEKATRRLQQFREQTKGLRDERILGTSTTAPDFAYEALTLLKNAKSLNYNQALKLKQDLRTISQLASKQKRVYERALEEQMTELYFEQLDRATKNMNIKSKERAQSIKTKIKDISPRQRQNFYMSSKYQTPQKLGKYKKITDWARANSGNSEMSEDEAGIYLIESRLDNGLGIGALAETYNVDDIF